MVYRTAVTKADKLERERRAFALKLGSAIAAGKKVIYLDEASFNAFIFKPKAWSHKQKPVEIPINNSRHGTTLFGAIGSCLTHPCFRLAASTNRIAFRQFIHQVSGSVRSRIGGKPYLVLDNASAHKTKANRALLDQHFNVLFQPPGTP